MKPLLYLVHLPSVEPDIIVDDEFSLSAFGINGRVIHTPGHTNGSISVLLNGGEAIVGDLASNRLHISRGVGSPNFGDSIDQIRESWRCLLNAGACVIYGSHGPPFSASLLRSEN